MSAMVGFTSHLWPLVLFCLCTTAFRIYLGDVREPIELQTKTTIETTAKRTPVIIHIFDEWDYTQTFEAPGKKFEGLEELKNYTFWASNAFAPGEKTADSIPSYLSGKKFTTRVDDSNGLINDRDGRKFPSEFDTLPEKAYRNQYNIGILGTVLPYCRMFSSVVKMCETFHPYVYSQYPSKPSKLLMESSVGSLLKLITPPKPQDGHALMYQHSMEHWSQLLSDRSIDFIFAHWLIPHHPYLVHPRDPQRSYNSNLEHLSDLVQRTNQDLKDRGLWDQSLIVWTSDHRNRYLDWSPEVLNGSPRKRGYRRIPFFVKFPHQTAGREYEAPFNTVYLHQLVSRALDQKIKSVSDSEQWTSSIKNEDFCPLHRNAVIVEEDFCS